MNPNDTQPIRNDGERCIYCGKKNKELALATSVTRYCPDCEKPDGRAQTDFKLIPKKSLDRKPLNLIPSDIDLEQWFDDLFSQDPLKP